MGQLLFRNKVMTLYRHLCSCGICTMFRCKHIYCLPDRLSLTPIM